MIKNNIIVELAIGFMMILVMLFDLYSQYIRGNVSKRKSNQLIAKANWVQYQARILTMVSVVILTYSYEKNFITFSIFYLLSLVFLMSALVGVIYIRYFAFYNFANILLNLPTYFSFKNSYREKYFFKIKMVFGGVWGFSLLLNLMINLAIAIPFVLATNNPEIRMTSAYIGQALNFIASVVNFNLVEPKFYRAIDEGVEASVSSQIILSKIISNLIAAIALFVLY
jgi:hypothetical protein